MSTNLRAARRARNLTQHQLGRLVGGGTTQAAISRWESGTRRPRRRVHERLELALGQPIYVLLAEDKTTTGAASKETTPATSTPAVTHDDHVRTEARDV